MRRSGFTLIELAIIITIIGLVIGGIVAGKTLMRNAELNSLVKNIDQLRAGIELFKLQYDAIPGDFMDAERYWGEAAAGAACATTIPTGTLTCDGNGNGNIYYQEGFYFWRHLSNAGFIAGDYSGIAGPSNQYWDAIIDFNVPKTPIDNVGYSVLSLVYSANGKIPAIDGSFGSSYRYTINQIFVGKKTGTMWMGDPFLSSNELLGIDTKMDDARPGTGKVIASNYKTCTDVNNALDAASDVANYDLSLEGEGCSFILMPSATGL